MCGKKAEELHAFFIGAAVGALLLHVVLLVCGAYDGKRNTRAEAIKAGVAYWTADPVTGATKFMWRTPVEPTAPETP